MNHFATIINNVPNQVLPYYQKLNIINAKSNSVNRAVATKVHHKSIIELTNKKLF
jgi:hypothetical protein